MLLLSLLGNLMIKRQTVTACNGRWRKRKSSAIRTLVAETLVLAKTHGYVEKIEDELEREIALDISDPPQEKIQRWRREGDRIFKSKHVLLTVVILCILDCALVLGELALDLYKVKGTLEFTSAITKSSLAFMQHLKTLYPALLTRTPYEIFNLLLESTVIYPTSPVPANSTNYSNTAMSPSVNCLNASSGGDFSTAQEQLKNRSHFFIPSFEDEKEDYNLYIIEKIAHIFHYCSISILAVILLETVMKAVCAGRSFFHRKLEVFDAFIVAMSIIVDVAFLIFLPDIDTKDFVFILAILLPWRVIRVVNSLVVSVKDHEHFRLKLVYKRKKKIQSNLRDTEAMLQKYMSQVTTLQRLCIMEGIEEWKVDSYLKHDDLPVTPSKKKFKFKMDDSFFHMQSHNRAPRCSLPSLDFHGLKLPAHLNASKSRISLPSVAHQIKQQLSKTSRRASLAAIELYNTKISNGDIRKKKFTSEDLCTMHEENIDDDAHDSALSSRATSESGDVFSRASCSDSIESDNTAAECKVKSRHNSEVAESDKEDKLKLAKIQEEAKRRHSESMLDPDKLPFQVSGFSNDVVTFRNQYGKTFTRPALAKESSESDDEIVGEDDFDDDDSDTSIPRETIDQSDSVDFTNNEDIDKGLSIARIAVVDESEGIENNNDTANTKTGAEKDKTPEAPLKALIQTANETRIVIQDMSDMSDDRHTDHCMRSKNNSSPERWV